MYISLCGSHIPDSLEQFWEGYSWECSGRPPGSLKGRGCASGSRPSFNLLCDLGQGPQFFQLFNERVGLYDH